MNLPDKERGYKINEFSKLLGLSREMIRYYEKSGAVIPRRDQDNNYRVYSIMDYFSFAEAISYTQFNAGIKEIHQLVYKDFPFGLKRLYSDYIKHTRENIGTEELLIHRAQELLDRIALGELNLGHVWVKKENRYKLFPLLESVNDVYGDVLLPDSAKYYLNKPICYALSDGFLFPGENGDRWMVGYQEQYDRIIENPNQEDFSDMDETYCLCSVADMGEIGSFHSERFLNIIKKMKEQPYQFAGPPRGKLLGRGKKDGRFTRLIELQIPIKP